MVSTAASFVSVGASVSGNELHLQYEPADAPRAESQPQSLVQSRPQSLSHSQEAEAMLAPATSSVSPAATNAAAAADAHDGEVVEGAVAADQQACGWGNGTGSSELSGLGRTGGSVSSKSGTRRRKVGARLTLCSCTPSLVAGNQTRHSSPAWFCCLLYQCRHNFDATSFFIDLHVHTPLLSWHAPRYVSKSQVVGTSMVHPTSFMPDCSAPSSSTLQAEP